MKHRAVIFHIHYHTVNNNQWLSIGIKTVDTIDEHYVTKSIVTTTANGTDISIKSSLNKWVD